MPLLTRRIRVLTDWTLSLFFRRDVVSYGGSAASPTLGPAGEGTEGSAA
jgi:hypothetical protein